MSYLIGSIPFGFILTKIFLKKDIRQIGSGNIGATNALRTGNKILGYSTLALDISTSLAAASAVPPLHACGRQLARLPGDSASADRNDLQRRQRLPGWGLFHGQRDDGPAAAAHGAGAPDGAGGGEAGEHAAAGRRAGPPRQPHRQGVGAGDVGVVAAGAGGRALQPRD